MSVLWKFCPAVVALLCVSALRAQQLPTQWESLRSEDFVRALEQARDVCIPPFGIIEKHGPSGPLGTDSSMYTSAALEAVQLEYAIVFRFAG